MSEVLGSRQRNIVLLGWTSRLAAMVVSLAMIRIALRLLGESQFAVFQILTAALAWLALSSFGLGPALKNLVSECRARGESDRQLREASAALLTLLFVTGTVILFLLGPAVSAGLLRKLTHDELWAYRAFVAGGLMSLIAALGQVSLEVLYAEFRAQWVYFLSLLGSALTVGLLLVLRRLNYDPPVMLFWVVCATLAPQALTGLFALRMTGLLPTRLVMPNRAAVARIVPRASRFALFAILSSLILMVDSLVISQILGMRDIVLYLIMMKLVAVGLVLYSTAIAVVWPEWTHNWELRQWTALRKRVRSFAMRGVAVCIPGAALAVFTFPFLIRVWLQDANVVPSTFLVLEFVAYVAVRFWTDAHSAALLSGNRVFVATRFAAIQALITAPLEYLFGRRWGAEGVIFGLVLGFLATAAWMFPRRFSFELRRGAAQEAALP